MGQALHRSATTAEAARHQGPGARYSIAKRA